VRSAAALAVARTGSQVSHPAAARCQGLVRQRMHRGGERMSADEPAIDAVHVTHVDGGLLDDA
ncbi:MAG: hypothetical protein QOF86_500, partial [Baekduia sp.]|nr:hypothetical protein [Baekduia sp.]